MPSRLFLDGCRLRVDVTHVQDTNPLYVTGTTRLHDMVIRLWLGSTGPRDVRPGDSIRVELNGDTQPGGVLGCNVVEVPVRSPPYECAPAVSRRR